MAKVTAARPFFYGLDPAADLYADEIESRGLGGIAFRAHHAGESVMLKLPLLGRHSVHTALAAAAAGLLLGLGVDAIVDGLRDESAQLRLLAVPSASGGNADRRYLQRLARLVAGGAESAGRAGWPADRGAGRYAGAWPVEEEAHRGRPARRRGGRYADQRRGGARWIADEARASGMGAGQITILDTNEEGDRAARRNDANGR